MVIYVAGALSAKVLIEQLNLDSLNWSPAKTEISHISYICHIYGLVSGHEFLSLSMVSRLNIKGFEPSPALRLLYYQVAAVASSLSAIKYKIPFQSPQWR